MKHTQGPWKIDKYNSIVYPDNKTILINGSIGYTMNESDEHKFNAKLIAAAPDLLEACISVLEALKASGNSRNFNAPQLREAIKKATE